MVNLVAEAFTTGLRDRLQMNLYARSTRASVSSVSRTGTTSDIERCGCHSVRFRVIRGASADNDC
jgi:hypothetical protein